MTNVAAKAKEVLAGDAAVPYGVFGVIASAGFFPPRPFLNEFFMQGSDPCDQDGRLPPWLPFEVTTEDYEEVKSWWIAEHPGAVEHALGAAGWNAWVEEILDR